MNQLIVGYYFRIYGTKKEKYDKLMTWEIVVTGKVQGVFFRASTKAKARELGLNGWVRNHMNGSVIIKVQGEESMLKSFLEWVHQGPERAIVDQVRWDQVDEEEEYGDFEVRR